MLTACGQIGDLAGSSDSSSTTVFDSLLKQIGIESEATVPVVSTSANDMCYAVAHDSNGNFYCSGYTSGNLGEANGGGRDAVVVKINSSGVIQWITQLGATTAAASPLVLSTAGNDAVGGIVVDSSGNVFCSGYTTGNLAEANGGGYDSFFMKLDSSGAIQWITQLGSATEAASPAILSTAGNEYGNKIVLDSSGNIFSATSTTGSLAEANGGSFDAILYKVSSSGSVVWASQLGAATETASPIILSTSGQDFAGSLILDSSGNIYMSGNTTSNLSEANGGQADAFIAKFDASGAVQWLTQIGAATAAASPLINSAAGYESCSGIGVDSSDNVYCAGSTDGNLADTNGGGSDIFAMKVDSSGSLLWATQLGTTANAASAVINDVSNYESCVDAAVDSSGNVFCGGEVDSPFAETSGPASTDAVVVKFNSSGAIQWARQFGSVSVTDPQYNASFFNAISVSSSGNIFAAGMADGDLAETSNGSGQSDMFIARLKPDGSL